MVVDVMFNLSGEHDPLLFCLLCQTVELASRSKELSAAKSKREQLENLLEKSKGSQAMSTDLQKQVDTVSTEVHLACWKTYCVHKRRIVFTSDQLYSQAASAIS